MTIRGIAISAATAALAFGTMVPSAQAEPSSFQFLSPTGDVGCQLGTTPSGSAYAWCKANEQNWEPPPSSRCPVANVPGAIGDPGGEDVQLAEGQPPCFGFVMSQLFFAGQYAPPSLAYGDRRSVGSISCVVDVPGVTCTDSTTGRSFLVSRDSYALA